MKWKDFARDYLHFSRKDRTAAILLIAGMAAIYAIPFVVNRGKHQGDPVANDILQKAIDTLERRRAATGRYREADESGDHSYSKTLDYAGKQLFPFDPNTLATGGWEDLGLPPKAAKTIHNYVSKGGRFRRPEDLKKIWGLPRGFYERVAPYIRIKDKPDETKNFPKPFERGPARSARNLNIADINLADSTAWIALPGVGQKLAARIRAFRDKLGGFYAVQQVAETYGLPDSTFQKIKPYLQVGVTAVRRLNINTALKEELAAHPYVRWHLSNAIVEYRSQHGKYKSLDELKKIELMDEATLKKVYPYLEL